MCGHIQLSWLSLNLLFMARQTGSFLFLWCKHFLETVLNRLSIYKCIGLFQFGVNIMRFVQFKQHTYVPI